MNISQGHKPNTENVSTVYKLYKAPSVLVYVPQGWVPDNPLSLLRLTQLCAHHFLSNPSPLTASKRPHCAKTSYLSISSNLSISQKPGIDSTVKISSTPHEDRDQVFIAP